MTNSSKRQVVWVKRNGAGAVEDAVLRERAGVEGPDVAVRVEALDPWGIAVIPAGSRDEWGWVTPEILNLGHSQLPPEGRVYVIDMD